MPMVGQLVVPMPGQLPKEHPGLVVSAAFSPDGEHVVFCLNDNGANVAGAKTIQMVARCGVAAVGAGSFVVVG